MKKISFFLFLFLFFVVNVSCTPMVYSSDIGVVWKLPKFVPVPSNVDYQISGSDIYIRVLSGDREANVSVDYKVSPVVRGLSVIFSESSFLLAPNSRRTVYVTINIASSIPEGIYNITFRVNIRLGSGTNVIDKAYEYITTIKVGGPAIKVRVLLENPDGSPVFGLIRVAYVYQDQPNYLFETYGYYADFYLVEGQYIFEGIVSGYRVRKDIYVDKDTSVILVVSTIIVEDFEIVHKPESPKDPIIFRMTVKSLDPTSYRMNVTVYYDLYNSENKSITNKSFVASIVINGRTKATIHGFIENPSGFWKNDTYFLRIYLISPKNKTLYMLEEKITIVARVYAPQPPEIPKIVIIAYPIMGGIIGALFMYILLVRFMALGLGWGKKIKVKFIGIWNTVFLTYYSVLTNRFLEIKDKVTASLLPLLTILTTAQETIWRGAKEKVPVSTLMPHGRIIAYPIDRGFVVFAYFTPEAYEYNKRVLGFLQSLAFDIKALLDKYEIRTYEEFSYGQPNFIGELEEIFLRNAQKFKMIP